MPLPLLDSPKCDGCSLVGVCLPDETNLLVTGKSRSVRRLIPANDNALPMYVTVAGAKVRKSGDTLRVTQRDTSGYDEARLIDVSRLSLFGNVQLTTQALRELCHRGIPITYHSTGGWFYGITTGPTHKNVALRQQQYATAADPVRSLQLARAFVKGKILNCRTMLMRNHSEVPDAVLRSLKELAAKTDEVASAESLLGLEGTAARDYFSCFSGMLKPPDGDLNTFSFTQRNRRPPRDEVNALLSFAYSLLTKELVVAALAVGFDPFLGFYHRPRYGRPSLALDLMEEFRPLVADSIVITAVNNGIVKRRDFVRGAGSVNLKPAARRRFIGVFTKRMDQLIRHPVFRYRISYSRILEVQARLLGRFLTRELDTYPSFQTR